MRTGLRSLRKALETLGHNQIYDPEQIVSTFELWDDIMKNDNMDAHTCRNIFQGAKVAMGMPVFVFWEQILAFYPNAKVILTIRDEDEWVKSVLNAKTMMDNEMPGAPLALRGLLGIWEGFLAPSYHKFCEVLRFAWGVTLGGLPMSGEVLNEMIVRGSYRRHNVYVRSILEGKATSKGEQQLLVYNVRDGWAPLCDFLGARIPSEEFPAVLEVPYFPGHRDAADGQEFDQLEADLLVPDSVFGLRMRQELRRGLAVTVLVVALVVAVPAVLAVRWQALQGLLALFVVVLLAIAWEVYVVMHTVVMRVDALVVLPLMMKSLLIATCLQACFITYGFLKEQMVTQDHIASPLLILSARLMSVFCGMVALIATEGRIHFGGVPLQSFVYFSVTNEGSTWAGYEMLKYVSFPVHVMAKSCTLLPSMLMGKLLNGTSYQWSQYGQAIAAMVCVTIMHLSEGHKEGGGHKQVAKSEISDFTKFVFGASLLVLFFACDSFTSQWQTSLYSKHKNLTKTQMMVCGNLVGLCITLISITAQFSRVRESVALVLADSAVLGRLVLLGLSAAMGQFCIYTAIKILGPLAFTWIMTTRQLLSVLISLVLFGHGVSVTKLTCIFIVFAVMSSKQLAKAGTAFKNRAKCKARSQAKARPGKDIRQWLNEQAVRRASQAAINVNSVEVSTKKEA
jgi:adenosine 3'-phospho 5'-phosphosulfate transporter B2